MGTGEDRLMAHRPREPRRRRAAPRGGGGRPPPGRRRTVAVLSRAERRAELREEPARSADQSDPDIATKKQLHPGHLVRSPDGPRAPRSGALTDEQWPSVRPARVEAPKNSSPSNRRRSMGAAPHGPDGTPPRRCAAARSRSRTRFPGVDHLVASPHPTSSRSAKLLRCRSA
jgi:hypothetical protein